jgi:uncharacterized protein YegP (UPF0339 family)
MPDIHLRADNGQCVCAEGGGGRQDVASRPGSGPRERFEVEYARSYSGTSSGERIELYLGGDGQYLWHKKTANNRERADGVEGYNDKEDCGAAALAVHDEPRADAAIYDMLAEEREKA